MINIEKGTEKMLYPVIDIGSNTVKIAVLDDENLFKQAPVFFKAVPLNIKSKILKSGYMMPQKMQMVILNILQKRGL